nr:hypothetical protein [Hyphomicrobium sp. MC1]
MSTIQWPEKSTARRCDFNPVTFVDSVNQPRRHPAARNFFNRYADASRIVGR